MRLHRSAAHVGVDVASGPVSGQICSDAILAPTKNQNSAQAFASVASLLPPAEYITLLNVVLAMR